MKPTEFPGRLVVADEGNELVHIDMYRTNALDRMRITVNREMLTLRREAP